MNNKGFNLIPEDTIQYWGASDLLAQVSDELKNNPTSCFSKNLFSWYNAVYTALSESSDCSYQVQINQSLCEREPPSSIEDVIEFINLFTSPMNVRRANAVIGIICRQIRRDNTIRRGPTIE